MKDLIEKLLLKNRTIVTSDVSECMQILGDHYSIRMHSFPSGEEYQTWPIPPEWNVVRAELKDGDEVIANYEECMLFLAPYSKSFTGMVSKNELMQHTYTNPEKPDSFLYEFRLAYNYQMRLQDWRITLPYERVEKLSDGPFQVDIKVETKPGEMLIAESSSTGSEGYWFTFLAHYCHIAQANDGLAGVAVMFETVKRIKQKYSVTKYGYKALAMPETIGSSVYAATHEEEIDNTIGAVFSEMGGADAGLQFVYSRRGDTYVDRVFLHVLQKRGMLPCRTIPFRRGWGNDELVFDAPGVGVPVVSLDRYPFERYHTHFDNMDLIKPKSLEETVDILMDVVDVLEADYIPIPKNRVPVYLSRYNLYADWTFNRNQYDINILLLDNLWSGMSVLDIALKNNINVDDVFGYINKFVDQGLIDVKTVSPDYTRQVRFLPDFLQE